MDPAVAKVVDLLEAEEQELRWAAAKVLGALKPNGAEVLPALTRALRSEDARLKKTALEAIAAIGGTDAYDAVAPLLEEPGDVGRRAMEVLGGFNADVLKRLKRRFKDASNTGRRRILTLAARLRGADGMDLIVRALEAGHTEEVLTIGRRLGDELASAQLRERKTLLRRLQKFLGSAAAGRDPEAAGAALELVARLEGAAAQRRILAFAGPEHPPSLRRRAIEALADVSAQTRLDQDVLGTILGFVQEDDFTNVAAPAMALLEKANLGAAHVDALLKCMEAADPALRRFAVNALGQVDTARSAAALLEVLKGDNPDLQKRAALSLTRQREAVAAASRALASAPDAPTAWVLARILNPHTKRLKPDQVALLASAAAPHLEAGDPRAEAIVNVLRPDHLDALTEACYKRARRIRKARKGGEIVNLLRPLVRDGGQLAPDLAYEMALAEIVRGKKNVLRGVRLANPGLQMLVELFRDADFPLLTRLKRDKGMLTPEEYYIIGSHFAERIYADRAFGGDLLRWVIKTFPDDSSAQAAEHKLHMEGFPPPPKRRVKPAAKKKADPAPKKAAVKKAPVRKKAAKKRPAAAKKKAPARKSAKRK